MKNQEKRVATIITGTAFVAFNAFMFVLWRFEPDPVNQEGIRYVQGLLDATFICLAFVYVIANVAFPTVKDDPEEGDDF